MYNLSGFMCILQVYHVGYINLSIFGRGVKKTY